MAIFNRKYSKIIKLASTFDEELNSQLQHMLSKLSKQHSVNCFVGEEFHDDANKTWFENFNRHSINNVTIIESNLMHEEDGNTHFGLNLANFSDAWLDNLSNYKSLKAAKKVKNQDDNHILNLYVYKYRNGDIDDLELGLGYSLRVYKIKNKLVLDYERYNFLDFNGEKKIEIQITKPADENELYNISKLENPLTVG